MYNLIINPWPTSDHHWSTSRSSPNRYSSRSTAQLGSDRSKPRSRPIKGARQRGHVLCSSWSSHLSKHLMWNTWQQFSSHTLSSPHRSFRQTAHVALLSASLLSISSYLATCKLSLIVWAETVDGEDDEVDDDDDWGGPSSMEDELNGLRPMYLKAQHKIHLKTLKRWEITRPEYSTETIFKSYAEMGFLRNS